MSEFGEHGLYSVDEIARLASVGVDTVRYYQRRGLLHSPSRRGRRAVYNDDHLERLQRIREHAAHGFSLDQIAELLADDGDPLISALAAGSEPTLSRAELASATGLDLSTIDLVVEAGLIRPDDQSAAERFPASSVAMLEAAGQLISSGIPLQDLFEIALSHAANIDSTVDAAVEIFRSRVVADTGDRAEAAALTRTLVPVVTRLVAEHFAQRLVTKALEALDSDDEGAGVSVRVEWTGDS